MRCLSSPDVWDFRSSQNRNSPFGLALKNRLQNQFIYDLVIDFADMNRSALLTILAHGLKGAGLMGLVQVMMLISVE